MVSCHPVSGGVGLYCFSLICSPTLHFDVKFIFHADFLTVSECTWQFHPFVIWLMLFFCASAPFPPIQWWWNSIFSSWVSVDNLPCEGFSDFSGKINSAHFCVSWVLCSSFLLGTVSVWSWEPQVLLLYLTVSPLDDRQLSLACNCTPNPVEWHSIACEVSPFEEL